MNGWMNGCGGECTDGWLDGWMDEWVHGWLSVCIGCLLVVDLLGLWRGVMPVSLIGRGASGVDQVLVSPSYY